MAQIVWYSENMEEKNSSVLFRDPNWAKNMQFGADADIYMDKKWWNSDACIDLYNIIYLRKKYFIYDFES